jgi:HAL2 family 3'(2'),5'-bisphosphate nucleotidase
MSNGIYHREQEIAIRAIRRAAGLCRSVQEQLSLSPLQKGDRSPVTVADFGSQAIICRELLQAFPDDPVIAEEGSGALREGHNARILAQVVHQVQRFHSEATDADVCRWIDHGHVREYSERFWTLDPIDGTKGFLRADQYALALALIVHGQVQMSVLACPQLPFRPGEQGPVGAIFVAERGRGASALPLDHAGKPAQVRVSQRNDPALVRFCESVESGHSSHSDAAAIAARLGITSSPVRLDSQAKYAVVARGEADIYLRLPTSDTYRENIWDHAAGALITSEAGGVVTDIVGRPLDFSRGHRLYENQGVIVTNGPLHQRVLEAIQAADIGNPA